MNGTINKTWMNSLPWKVKMNGTFGQKKDWQGWQSESASGAGFDWI